MSIYNSTHFSIFFYAIYKKIKLLKLKTKESKQVHIPCSRRMRIRISFLISLTRTKNSMNFRGLRSFQDSTRNVVFQPFWPQTSDYGGKTVSIFPWGTPYTVVYIKVAKQSILPCRYAQAHTYCPTPFVTIELLGNLQNIFFETYFTAKKI